MNLKSYCDGQLHVNDCVSISVSDYGWGSSTYEGMIIKMTEGKICVLFTDGDVCDYNRWSHKLKLLDVRRSLSVGDKILKVLENMENQNTKIEEQKSKINANLSKLFQ